MADPHKGGTCPDGGSPGFMRVIDDGDGLETIVCRRDGSWVQQVAATGVAVEYSDYSESLAAGLDTPEWSAE